MAKRKRTAQTAKTSHSWTKVLALTALAVVAVVFFLITGDVPPVVQELFPQELREVLFPKTPPPSAPDTPTPDVTPSAVTPAPGVTPSDATQPETPQPGTPAMRTPVMGTPAMGLPNIAGNISNDSFNRSKRLLMELHVKAGQFITFYCGSRFDANNTVYHDKSGFTFKSDETRANRLEWEHVVPAEAFGQSFSEWREGHPECVDSRGRAFKGRDCAEKVNLAYRYMQADLFNLQPAIGEVNGRRSNYSFAMIEGEKREFGACNMEIEGSKAEPPDNRFGDIARTYMYMEAAYPGHGIIGSASENLFAAWNNLDPVDAWECERVRLIAGIQGNRNVIVEEACAAAGL